MRSWQRFPRVAVPLLVVVLVTACGATPNQTRHPAASPGHHATRFPSPSSNLSGARYSPAANITVPAGFVAQIYARGLNFPTAMAFGPDGRLYVAEQGGEVVTVLPNSTAPTEFASGYATPLGLAWLGQTLFVSAEGQLDSIGLASGVAGHRGRILSNLPYGEHQQDGVVVAPNGRLYLGSGSTCDVCTETNPDSGVVLSLNPNGTDLAVYARGLRNPYGLAVQPSTGQLYADVNGQDNLGNAGDPEPADMLVAVRSGANYGWPRCWPDARLLVMEGQCRGVTPPAAYLAPHAAPTGMAFYSGASFPGAYEGNLFISEWGSNFSYDDTGHVVVRVVLNLNGSAPISEVSVFASGFEHPIAVVVAPDGAILVADWGRGIIYRIQAAGAR